MSEALDRLARRAEGEEFFLAALLAVYADSERLDEGQMAAALGCAPEALRGLRLCRAPRADGAAFRQDVQAVADHFGLDVARLTGVVRRAQALARFRAAGVGPRGLLLAAREAQEGEE